ncbi:hypothetical protein [Spirosoma aerolatum]|uniref:hypothetical protein n=1 Tax=Spirosoma aerolatum TaxID=1211326 RepID=UPI0009ADB7C6|nr:hypothetical protein [Spirosoma aerolatum]
MAFKLKLSLKKGEVVALTRFLATELARVPMDDLRANPADYVIMSAMYELYSKVKEKAENIRLFPSKRKGELYSITISRTQALAICCVLVDVPDQGNSLQTYEANFITGLIGTIHQTFLI